MQKEKTEKKLFTVEEYYRMFEAGVFGGDARVELVDGEVYEMAAMGSRHAACVRRLNALFNRLGGDFLVGVQDPVLLHEYSEPEPDIALLKFREDFYESGHPKPEDVLLAVEVSDTSLEYDINVKLPAYARAGIPELWIVDLNSRSIKIHSNPESGEYRSTSRVKRGEAFGSKRLPDAKIAANDILG